jgi:hypothetical protein
VIQRAVQSLPQSQSEQFTRARGALSMWSP